MADSIRRIGVLTGGGDCPGLNAVIRAVTKTAISRFGWEVMGIEDGFEGLIQPGKIRPLGMADVRGILPRGGTILGTTNRADPFHYPVENDGKKRVLDLSDTVLAHTRESGIDALVAIGGDGSLRITQQLIEKGLRAVAVPKTIDNDLQGTAVTFGFDTALNTAMDAMDKLHTTAESHHRVMILEVMGRDAGWIALEAGIAGGADVILIPEIPYDMYSIVSHISARHRRGAKFSIVIAAEGAQPEGGERAYLADDGGPMRRLGGIGERLAEMLNQVLNIEVRVTVLGHLQRGGSPSCFDRLLASRFGVMAVEILAQGKLGHMVALVDGQIVAIPLADAVGQQKLVPLDSDIVRTALDLGISLGSSKVV